MKYFIITILIFVSLFHIGCTTDQKHEAQNTCTSNDNMLSQLETICLEYQNENIVLSLKIREKAIINDYNLKYLGSIQVGDKSIKILEKYILSGQEIDAQRANISIMLFFNNKLYGEYTGLNNNYSVSVFQSKLTILNKETNKTTQFEMSDSIPEQLFIPYSSEDSIQIGDVLYLNRRL